ncbi:MAG: hypothetical protein ACR2P2_11485 [Nakamurella sp.]
MTMTDWRTSLQHFAGLAATTSAEWMLVGSGASAVHGVELSPGDIDVLARTANDVTKLAAVLPSLELPSLELPGQQDLDPQTFRSSTERPLLTFGGWTFGRWFLDEGTVEVAHIAGVHRGLTENGGEVWRHRRLVRWRGNLLPIVPLEIQLATMLSRQLDDRSQASAECLRHNGYDAALLRLALRDRGIDPASLPGTVPPDRSLASW